MHLESIRGRESKSQSYTCSTLKGGFWDTSFPRAGQMDRQTDGQIDEEGGQMDEQPADKISVVWICCCCGSVKVPLDQIFKCYLICIKSTLSQSSWPHVSLSVCVCLCLSVSLCANLTKAFAVILRGDDSCCHRVSPLKYRPQCAHQDEMGSGLVLRGNKRPPHHRQCVNIPGAQHEAKHAQLAGSQTAL